MTEALVASKTMMILITMMARVTLMTVMIMMMANVIV